MIVIQKSIMSTDAQQKQSSVAFGKNLITV